MLSPQLLVSRLKAEERRRRNRKAPTQARSTVHAAKLSSLIQ
jgi:hypothetical protein